MARSSFYYRCTSGKRGRKLSTHTCMQDGSWVSNESVVIAIRFILAEEFMGCGYIKMTDDLREQGFVINYKKTYRLMKEQRLLCGRMMQAGSGSSRQFVRWRVQQASRPMEQLCMDIKYIHIHGQRRNALLLTVLDVYTRSILGQLLWWQMRERAGDLAARPDSAGAPATNTVYNSEKRQRQSVYSTCIEGLLEGQASHSGVYSRGHTTRELLHRGVPHHHSKGTAGTASI